jgi:hypothetical protein
MLVVLTGRLTRCSSGALEHVLQRTKLAANGERRCRDTFGESVTPDGYGRVELRGRSVAFLLELDRGTEDHERLREKARRYARALPDSAPRDETPPIILAVPSSLRAARADESLAPGGGSLVPVAWSAGGGCSPLDVVIGVTRDTHQYR